MSDTLPEAIRNRAADAAEALKVIAALAEARGPPAMSALMARG
jgi:hypothetical protein